MASERFDHYATVYETEDSADYCGLQTGFAGVDARLTGLATGQLIVLAACDHRPDKRPQLSDLRDSCSIEQDADSVLMLY